MLTAPAMPSLYADLSDYELLRRWRAGENEAGAELFNRYNVAIGGFIRRKVSSEADASDLLMKTFLGCIETKKEFRGDSSVKTYLYGIAKLKILNFFRDNRRKTGRECPLDEYTSEDFGPDPAYFLEQDDAQRLVLKAMRRIPVHMQIALELTFWEDLSGPEIAEVLGIPKNTVRGRIFRAKKSLAAMIVKLENSPELLDSVTVSYGTYLGNLRELAGYSDPPKRSS